MWRKANGVAALDGTWNGTRQKIVWTGSENWSDKSLYNDEVTLGGLHERDGILGVALGLLEAPDLPAEPLADAQPCERL